MMLKNDVGHTGASDPLRLPLCLGQQRSKTYSKKQCPQRI
ncbi:hypothetical protein SDC9_163220 [bioreactor metagenome]|uniref:Uncharacterized protein n=1 Tax=bioreactor metagenome TaxID=1076179 RepID=A0A645FV33_9ZZZZ